MLIKNTEFNTNKIFLNIIFKHIGKNAGRYVDSKIKYARESLYIRRYV